MPKILFRVLRQATKDQGWDNRDIAEIIECSAQHVSDILNGRAVFTQIQQYALMDAMKWPYADMYLLFPKNGIEIKAHKRIEIVKEYCEETGQVLVPRVAIQTIKTVIQEAM